MNSFIKLLIATACLVVVASGGNYIYKARCEEVKQKCFAEDTVVKNDLRAMLSGYYNDEKWTDLGANPKKLTGPEKVNVAEKQQRLQQQQFLDNERDKKQRRLAEDYHNPVHKRNVNLAQARKDRAKELQDLRKNQAKELADYKRALTKKGGMLNWILQDYAGRMRENLPIQTNRWTLKGVA